MINKWCHCEKCGHDWLEEDIRIEPNLAYQPKPEEVIKCPQCGEPDKS